MAPPTYAEQASRELLRLGLHSRLKSAPTLHFHEIGERKRHLHHGLEAALLAFEREETGGTPFTPAEARAARQIRALYEDPDVNAYLHAMREHDALLLSRPGQLTVLHHWEHDTLVLDAPGQATGQFLHFFHPLRWPKRMNWSTWELLRDALPAMAIAAVRPEIYQTDRWLYDETAQRSAETLTERLLREGPAALPARIELNATQRDLFNGYTSRLAHGLKARQWFQNRLKALRTRPPGDTPPP